jgi:hypothetical protein
MANKNLRSLMSVYDLSQIQATENNRLVDLEESFMELLAALPPYECQSVAESKITTASVISIRSKSKS